MPKREKSEFEQILEKVFDRKKFAELSADMRKNVHAFFENFTNDENNFGTAFVTREEFSVQKQLVEELIAKLDRIEKQLGIKTTKLNTKKKAVKKAKKAKK